MTDSYVEMNIRSKITSSSIRCIRCICWITVAVLFTTTLYASEKEVESVLRGDKLQTIAGMLRTPQTRFKDGSWINRITLGDKVVFEDSRYLGTIGVEASYPADKPARLVLLSINTDARSCPMALQVLEIRGKDDYMLSKEFGNCLPPANPKWFKMLKENPSYRNGEWHIALPPPGPEKIDPAHWTKFEWYVYRDGHIIKKPSP